MDLEFETQILNQGRQLIKDSFYSDICLIYPPAQVGMACLLLVCSNVEIDQLKLSIEKEIKEINSVIIGGLGFTVKQALKDDKKLKAEQLLIRQMSIIYFEERFSAKKQSGVFDQLHSVLRVIQGKVIKGIIDAADKDKQLEFSLQKPAIVKID